MYKKNIELSLLLACNIGEQITKYKGFMGIKYIRWKHYNFPHLQMNMPFN